MSLAVNPALIFGDTGFYDGEDVEVACSVEVIYDVAPQKSHQADGGIESHSHKRLKRSMRLNFKQIFRSSRNLSAHALLRN